MTGGLDQRLILKLALVSEGVLAAAALAWSQLRGIQIVWDPAPRALAIGAVAVIPLFVFNYLLFGLSTIDREPWRQLARFRSGVILPLCRNISVPGALLIGVLSGFAEEYLFRGVINPECISLAGTAAGITAGSLIFSYVHFIGSAREFWLLVPVYAAIGGYLSAIHALGGSIWAPILAHGIYNFLAIIYFRKEAIRMSIPE